MTKKEIKKNKNKIKNKTSQKIKESCGILLITIGIIISLALATNSNVGIFGEFIHIFYALTFGKYLTYSIPFILILIGLYPFTFISRKIILKITTLLTCISLISIATMGVYNEYVEQLFFNNINYAEYIGYIGFYITQKLIEFIGILGSFILLFGATLILLIFSFDFKLMLIINILIAPVTILYSLFIKIKNKLFKNKIKKNILNRLSNSSIDIEKEYNLSPKESLSSQKNNISNTSDTKNEPLKTEQEKVSSPLKVTKNNNKKINDLQIEKQTIEEEVEYTESGKVVDKYKMPSVDLLEEAKSVSHYQNNEVELRKNAQLLKEKLNEFSIDAEVVQINPGPVITQYEIRLAPGVKVSKINSLDKDLAMTLKARSIRIVAPIPGKNTIGIELPNAKPSIVRIKSIINSEKFINSNSKLTIALGKNITGETYVLDLAKTPHLLIAGSTGAGKSVCINGIIMSILYRCTPSEVQFCMIDPKKVELSVYANLINHHLLQVENITEPVVTDPKDAVRLLNSLVVEMESRYELLMQTGTRKIDEYNELIESGELTLNPETADRLKKMPYIVCIVDEYGDLMMTSGKAVEDPIIRLAQMARAVGIHMIIATQRPSVKVVTGIIKANFPTRIGFRVMSVIDSRTILDSKGAESLLGKGDMLIVPPGEADLYRLQNALVETKEISRVVEHIKKQPQTFEKIKIVAEREEQEVDLDAFDMSDNFRSSIPKKTGKTDALYNEAKRMIIQNQMASVSMLQRGLSVGYARAGKLIDQLEKDGIVGPHEGSKSRKVLVKGFEQNSE